MSNVSLLAEASNRIQSAVDEILQNPNDGRWTDQILFSKTFLKNPSTSKEEKEAALSSLEKAYDQSMTTAMKEYDKGKKLSDDQLASLSQDVLLAAISHLEANGVSYSLKFEDIYSGWFVIVISPQANPSPSEMNSFAYGLNHVQGNSLIYDPSAFLIDPFKGAEFHPKYRYLMMSQDSFEALKPNFGRSLNLHEVRHSWNISNLGKAYGGDLKAQADAYYGTVEGNNGGTLPGVNAKDDLDIYKSFMAFDEMDAYAFQFGVVSRKVNHIIIENINEIKWDQFRIFYYLRDLAHYLAIVSNRSQLVIRSAQSALAKQPNSINLSTDPNQAHINLLNSQPKIKFDRIFQKIYSILPKTYCDP